MVLGALAMGFKLEDLYDMALNDFFIFSAITREAYDRSGDSGGWVDASQEDIEALKRM